MAEKKEIYKKGKSMLQQTSVPLALTSPGGKIALFKFIIRDEHSITQDINETEQTDQSKENTRR